MPSQSGITMDEIRTKDRETLENEIIAAFREIVSKVDIEKLEKLSKNEIETIFKKKITHEERLLRQRKYQKKYREQNRESINQRQKRSRLGKKMLSLVPDHIFVEK